MLYIYIKSISQLLGKIQKRSKIEGANRMRRKWGTRRYPNTNTQEQTENSMIQLKKHMAKGHSVLVSSWKFQVPDKNKDISHKHGYCCSVLKMSRAGRHSLVDSLAGPLVFLKDTATPQHLETGRSNDQTDWGSSQALSTLLTGGSSLCPKKKMNNKQKTYSAERTCRGKIVGQTSPRTQ